ncbi:MAG: phosphate ABC transporter substrate-binding protein PstS [bacterium]
MKKCINILWILTVSCLCLVGCSGPATTVDSGTEAKETKVIMGAGATFPYPLYAKMFDAYYQQTGYQVNYQSIGSGGGVRQLLKKTVDFGATDAFITDQKMRDFPAEIVHIPTCLGAVAVSYHVPGVKSQSLRISAAVLADIFLGKIRYWNDARIVKDNPGVSLPKLKITPVYRSDGSGTTAIFTDYLTKVSGEWKAKVGMGKSVNWPMGVGAKGNAGVAGVLKQMPGGIAYINLAYCIQNSLPLAAVENGRGDFVVPTIESTTLAASAKIPADTRVSITNSSVKNSYPISGFTWLIIYKALPESSNSTRISEIKDLFSWMVSDAQSYVAPLHYAPLPSNVRVQAQKIIDSIID